MMIIETQSMTRLRLHLELGDSGFLLHDDFCQLFDIVVLVDQLLLPTVGLVRGTWGKDS